MTRLQNLFLLFHFDWLNVNAYNEKFFFLLFIPRKAFKIDDKGMKIHPLYNIIFLWSHDIASNQHHGMYLSLYILPLMIRFISSAQTNERHIAAIIIKCSCVACRKQKKSVFYRAVERIFNLQFFFSCLHHHLYILLVAFFLHFRIVAAF